LRTPLPVWSALLPETREPRDVPLRAIGDWVLKGTFSNNGDAVIDRARTSAGQFRAAWARAWLAPGGWVAQRRFEVLPIDSPLGALGQCLGVYVIDGRAAGAYLRLFSAGLADYRAIDAALLVEGQP
jgi:hypothetical protein